MATTTGTIVYYDSFAKEMGDGTIDLDTHTFGMLLTTSTYTPNVATHTRVSDITNELVGNGYARATLGSVTFSQTGGVATFDFADPVFTASGGSLTARYYVVFDNNGGADSARALIAHGLLDNTPADVTATDGNTITFNVNASGFFTHTLTDA